MEGKANGRESEGEKKNASENVGFEMIGLCSLPSFLLFGRQEVLHVQGVHGHSSKWCKVLGKVGRSAVRPHLDISEDKSLMAIVVDEVVWTTRLV